MIFGHHGEPFGPSNFCHNFDYVPLVEYMEDLQGSCLDTLGWGHVIIFIMYANFKLSVINRIVPRSICPQSNTWRMLTNPHWILGCWSLVDVMYHTHL